MTEKRLTVAEVVEELAKKTGVGAEQVRAVLQTQAELAYANAKQGFPVPGIGLLIMSQSEERRMVMRFGPKTGQEIVIPAKQRLKFRISPYVKNVLLGGMHAMPDIFATPTIPGFAFSSEAMELSNPEKFIGELGTLTQRDGKVVPLVVFQLPDLSLPSGRIAAGDPVIGGPLVFARPVPPGKYPLGLVVAQLGSDERVAFAVIRFSNHHVATWEVAGFEDQNASITKGELAGYGVDSATGSFCDASLSKQLTDANEADSGFSDILIDELQKSYKSTRGWVHGESASGSLAAFHSGYGDGRYSSHFGLDDEGKPVILVTDFQVLKWHEGKPAR